MGDDIDDAEVNNIAIADTDGTNYLVADSSAYVVGEPNSFWSAIHLYPGGTRILDRFTVVPGYPVPHPGNVIGAGTIEGGNVAFFLRRYQFDPQQDSAICLYNGSSVTVLATRGSPIPGSAATFLDFDTFTRPYINEGAVVFAGQGLGISGIYEWKGGTITTVVDQNTPLPDESV